MKILVVSNLYPPIRWKGGAEVVARTIVEGLTDEGHDVLVVTTGEGESKEGKVKMVRFQPSLPYDYLFLDSKPVLSRLWWHIWDLFGWRTYYEVKKAIQSFQPDLIWCHNWVGLGLMGLLAVRRSGVPWIQHLHDIQLQDPSGMIIYGYNKSWLQKVLIWKYGLFTRQIIGKPTLVISPSRWLGEWYKQHGWFAHVPMLTIANPLPDGTVKGEYKEREQDGLLRLLYAGQITRPKGVEWLVETLADSALDFQLTVVGDGAMLEELRLEYGGDKRFVFLGKTDHQAVLEMMAESHCLIVPSLVRENCPTVILEAFGHGCAVVVNDVGGAGELVKESNGGFVVIPLDKNSLLEALNKRAGMAVMGKQALEWVKRRTLKKYLTEVLESIENKRP
ncbi:MAG: glycosyltransferase family 4 protein [bacterium]